MQALKSKQLKINAGLSIIYALLFFVGCKTINNQSIQNQTSANYILLDSLNLELEDVLQKSIMPGFAVSIVHQDKITFAKGFGYADLKNKTPFTDKTINCIASISKTFIGLAIMQLVDAGKLSLDEPINSILPYKVIHPFYPDKPITVRHLVTHTSTLTQEFDPEDAGEATIFLLEDFKETADTPEEFKKAITYYKMGKPISIDQHIQKFTQPSGNWYSKSNFENHPPGEKFDYTNLGAVVAARIVEIKSGMSFEAYTKEHIFEPLNMTKTSWHYTGSDASLLTKIYMPDNRRNPTAALEHPKYEMTDYPAGGLKTNIADLSKYLIEIMKGYNGNGKLLSKNSFQTLLNPQLPDSCFENRNDYPFNDQYGVGVFWAISAAGYRLHNGGSIGVYSFIYFDPKTQSGALSFCNLPVDDFGKVRDVIHKYQKLLSH